LRRTEALATECRNWVFWSSCGRSKSKKLKLEKLPEFGRYHVPCGSLGSGLKPLRRRAPNGPIQWVRVKRSAAARPGGGSDRRDKQDKQNQQDSTRHSKTVHQDQAHKPHKAHSFRPVTCSAPE